MTFTVSVKVWRLEYVSSVAVYVKSCGFTCRERAGGRDGGREGGLHTYSCHHNAMGASMKALTVYHHVTVLTTMSLYWTDV